MDFEHWYNYEVRETDFIMTRIVMSGRKLKHSDCEHFWTTYKKALKLAYEAGARTIESEVGGGARIDNGN